MEFLGFYQMNGVKVKTILPYSRMGWISIKVLIKNYKCNSVPISSRIHCAKVEKKMILSKTNIMILLPFESLTVLATLYLNIRTVGTDSSLKHELLWSSGHDVCLTRRRSPVRSWVAIYFGWHNPLMLVRIIILLLRKPRFTLFCSSWIYMTCYTFDTIFTESKRD